MAPGREVLEEQAQSVTEGRKRRKKAAGHAGVSPAAERRYVPWHQEEGPVKPTGPGGKSGSRMGGESARAFGEGEDGQQAQAAPIEMAEVFGPGGLLERSMIGG